MEDARADLTGEIVDGRFRVEARLGSGGMGTVWRVEHVVSLQRFALKTLDPSAAAQPEATRRFVREARAAAALRTRHVVKIVDAQMQYLHNGQPLPFLVMELLEGATLLELCDARGRLRPGELAWLAGQLGRALDAAHRQGIVHRDLKPSNVFIAEDDERQPTIKLCDFGIAKLIHAGGAGGEASLETNTGALLGTPMYLAPEMLRGASEAVPATDQWALGLLAFRALAGTEYFAHARGFPGLVLAIANDTMVAPSARAPSLPAAFDAWFLRSCARDPAARFPDVPAQVAALAAALGNPAPVPIAPFGKSGPTGTVRPAEPAADPALGPTQAAPRPVPRSRARLVLLATTVAWAIGALAAVAWREGRSRARPVAVATPAPSPPAAASPPTLAAAPDPAPPAPAAPRPPAPAAEPAPREAAPQAPPPVSALAPSPPVAVKEKRAHHHHTEAHAPAVPPLHAGAPVPAAPAIRPAVEPAHGKAKGASCQRSAECASGLCAAETCL